MDKVGSYAGPQDFFEFAMNLRCLKSTPVEGEPMVYSGDSRNCPCPLGAIPTYFTLGEAAGRGMCMQMHVQGL
jgi:hypothetical protein